MRLLQPEMGVWGLSLVAVVLFWGFRYAQRWRHRRAWPVAGRSQHRTGRARDLALLGFAAAAVLLITAALTRPQVRAERLTDTFEKQDLVLILDRSVSMQARDIAPSRSARAVAEIERFLRRRPATLDRVALVGFAGTSVVLSYPTTDFDALFFYLDWIRDDPSVLFGTDMGSALETALDVARRAPASNLPPVLVLMSDGEDQGGTLERRAADLREAGIRLYTVGIGSPDAVSIPVRTESGRDELLRDEAGRVMRTRFEEGTLRRLATLTGGQYFRSVSGGELSAALDDILTAERRRTGTRSEVVFRDLYPLLLAAAAAAVLGMVTTW